MKAIILLMMCSCMASCGGFIKADANGSTIVQGGFLSSIAGWSGKVHNPNGTDIAWSQTGFDGTSVANTLSGMVGSGVLAKYAFKGLDSNNGVKINSARQTTAQKANARPPTVTTPTVDPTTGQVLTPTVTQPAKAIVP